MQRTFLYREKANSATVSCLDHAGTEARISTGPSYPSMNLLEESWLREGRMRSARSITIDDLLSEVGRNGQWAGDEGCWETDGWGDCNEGVVDVCLLSSRLIR